MRKKALALAAAIGVSSVFFIDVCGLVFGCGCRSLWAGASEACNIHHAAGPHCPWCAHPVAAGAVAYAAMALVQALILFGPGGAGLPLRFTLALLSFPMTAGLVGTIQGILWDYWAR
ncbi:MAG: hypothetical protein ACRD1Z_01850 [Vicinamibacteria bacterium]